MQEMYKQLGVSTENTRRDQRSASGPRDEEENVLVFVYST